jgi:hypothetical protein
MDLRGGEPESVRPPDYLELVKAYADTMIKGGRDTYGEQHSPLFASAMSRKTLKIGMFPEIPGVRTGDRSLAGANPQTEYGLYSLLYELTQLTGEKKYAKEADRALEFFFKNCQSPKTGLMAWGEHIYWNFHRESMGGKDSKHEICGEWPFWDQCYRLAPDACWKFALGQWDHQVADKQTGDFSRHAKWSKHGPGRGADFPRYAGQMIACWADAYARKENETKKARSELLRAITTLVARMESNMRMKAAGYLLAGTDKTHSAICWPGSNLELARCLWKSASCVNSELAKRMKKLALQQDTDFLGLPHTIASGGGFVSTIESTTGKPRSRSMNKPYTETWNTGYGHGIHAYMANTCYSRLRQIENENEELAAKYRRLILAAAEQYLTAEPDPKRVLKPRAFAGVIRLLLNMHEMSGEKKYLDRADHFGRLGIKLFLGDGLALPKATNKHDHYEAITGGPAFMQVLLELHKKLDQE